VDGVVHHRRSSSCASSPPYEDNEEREREQRRKREQGGMGKTERPLQVRKSRNSILHVYILHYFTGMQEHM